jgi:predicted Zn-dependent peptidase
MGRLIPLGFNWVYRREYLPLADELKSIQNVSQEDIRRLVKEYPLENVTVLGLGPSEKIV